MKILMKYAIYHEILLIVAVSKHFFCKDSLAPFQKTKNRIIQQKKKNADKFGICLLKKYFFFKQKISFENQK